MHIENPDALKGWLTIKLAPLCDADPAALARYVCALLKKVKPEKELQASMQEQLDVFLGADTQPFLERLMDTIRTEEYLKTPPALLDPEAATAAANAVSLDTVAASQPRDAASPPPPSHRPQQSTKEESSRTGTGTASDDDCALRIDSTPSGGGGGNGGHSSSGGHSPIKPPIEPNCPSSGGSSSNNSNNNNNNNINPRRQQRLSARSRSRSRSRSPDGRRLAGRNARDSRDRLGRPSAASSSSSYRNKSPPGRRFDHHRQQRGMRGAAGGALTNDRYSRRNHSRSRSRSLSPSYRGALEHNNNNNSSSQSGEGGESRIQSQIIVGNQGGQPQQQSKGGNKCRDFEEKGYCMRGETCPWDHGMDPVVLEDINNPTLMTIQQQQQHLREYNPDAPDLWSRNNNNNGAAGGGGGGGGFGPRGPIGGRNGDFHSQQQRLPFRLSSGQVVGGMMNPGGGLSQLNRELIPVPVMMDGQQVIGGGGGMHHMMGEGGMGGGGHGGPKRRYEDQNQPLVPGMEGQPKRRPLAGRLGGRVGGPVSGNHNGSGGGGGGSPMGQQNCSLELRKVPRGLNSIAHLNNHFSKFGKIINIQVNYENDPEAAIVTFSSHAEANVAYRSTEAVLNNRFIKVFWHNNNNNINGKEGESVAKEGGEAQGTAPGVRKPNQYHLNNVLNKQQKEMEAAAAANAANAAGGGDQEGGGAPGNTPAATAVVALPAQLRLRVNRGQAMRRKQEEQVKAAVQMAQDLVKKKHDLLQEYLKQMRSCLELIEKLDAMDPQRAKLLQTLKDLQGSIDKLRKEIADEQKQLTAAQQQQQHGQQHPPAVMRMTREQQQKELLDLELELIAQQQEGNETTHIQRRIQELQRALGRGGGPGQFARGQQGGGGGGAGGQMMRGRVAPPGSTSVDRRPTTIFVAGFKVDDSDALLGHFKHFGEITKNVLDQSIPSLIISFAVRTHAEQAMQRGRIFKEKPLQINWYIPNFVKQRQPNEEAVGADVKPQQPQATVNEEVGEPVEGEGAPETTPPLMSTAAEVKEEEGQQDGQQAMDAAETVTTALAVAVKEGEVAVNEKQPKTELELEDELIGAVEDELPSGDVDDELRLDDEEDDLEDRSWRR